MKLSIAFLGFSISFGCLCFGQDSVLDQNMTVMTYNIRYLNTSDGQDIWQNRRQAVADTILESDVVGLQEVVLEQFQYLQAELGPFDWYGVGRDDGRDEGEMVPIGWRKELYEPVEKGTFWLSENSDEVGSVGWDAALPRIASWVRLRDKRTQQVWLVLNTHFDHRGRRARHESAKLLAQWLKNRRAAQPAVLLGDLNSVVTSPPLIELIQASDPSYRLRHAHAESLSPDPGPDSTWNGFQEIIPGRRIDYILVSGGVEVVSIETLNPQTQTGRFASDHLPVRASLRFPIHK